MQIFTFFPANLCIKTFIPLIYSHNGWTSYDGVYRYVLLIATVLVI